MVLGLVGCDGVRVIRSAREVAGEYAYPHKDGPIEVLTLRENFTYRQDLYADFATYRSYGEAKYSFEGGWSYERTRIEFKPFHTFTRYLAPNSFHGRPERVYNMDGYWISPTQQMPDALIDFAAKYGYVSVRITDRSELLRKSEGFKVDSYPERRVPGFDTEIAKLQ